MPIQAPSRPRRDITAIAVLALLSLAAATGWIGIDDYLDTSPATPAQPSTTASPSRTDGLSIQFRVELSAPNFWSIPRVGGRAKYSVNGKDAQHHPATWYIFARNHDSSDYAAIDWKQVVTGVAPGSLLELDVHIRNLDQVATFRRGQCSIVATYPDAPPQPLAAGRITRARPNCTLRAQAPA